MKWKISCGCGVKVEETLQSDWVKGDITDWKSVTPCSKCKKTQYADLVEQHEDLKPGEVYPTCISCQEMGKVGGYQTLDDGSKVFKCHHCAFKSVVPKVVTDMLIEYGFGEDNSKLAELIQEISDSAYNSYQQGETKIRQAIAREVIKAGQIRDVEFVKKHNEEQRQRFIAKYGYDEDNPNVQNHARAIKKAKKRRKRT